MTNTIIKTDIKEQNLLSLESLLNDVYLLPKWEKIKNITLLKKRILFSVKSINSFLFRKFSSKYNIEKYSLRDSEDNILANVDLRVYKDCVYIINLNVYESQLFDEAVSVLIQTAAEKALYNTTDKKLNINLAFSTSVNNKLKKIIMKEDFIAESEQSNYEKSMFGETYSLDVEKSSFWLKKIRQMHILINN